MLWAVTPSLKAMTAVKKRFQRRICYCWLALMLFFVLGTPAFAAGEISPARDEFDSSLVIDVPDEDVPLASIPDMEVPLASIPDMDVPLTDVPLTDVVDEDVPLADIPDGDVPLIEVPDEDVPLAEIPDEDVPLSGSPEEDVPVVDIPDEDVPLISSPQTGSDVLSPVLLMSSRMAFGAGLLMFVWTALENKNERMFLNG